MKTLKVVFGIQTRGNIRSNFNDKPADGLGRQLPEAVCQKLGAEARALVAWIDREKREFIAFL